MLTLSPFIWNNNISLALNLSILTLIIPHGLNVTSVIPPSIYSVGPGNLFMLLDPDIFCAPSFAVDSFRSPYCLCFTYPPFPYHLYFRYPLPSPCCFVLFIYPNHLILRSVVNVCVRTLTKRRKGSHPSDTVRQGRKTREIQPMLTNG